jgi:hypothetical protein
MKILIGVGIIILILLTWGLIGSSQVSEIGNTCDFGINNEGSIFCWKWHQNIVGDIKEEIEEIFNK